MPAVASAGYSGKPLWQMLGLAGGSRLFVTNPPPHLPTLLAGAPSGVVRLPRLGEFDIAIVFVSMRADVSGVLARLQPKLADGGMIWFAWTKKASGVATDVTEDVLRTLVLPTGLVDVKVCAIDATWSGLSSCGGGKTVRLKPDLQRAATTILGGPASGGRSCDLKTRVARVSPPAPAIPIRAAPVSM